MTIEALKDKHFINVQKADKYSYLRKDEEFYFKIEHTNLSIEYTISVLEQFVTSYKEDIDQEIDNLTEWGVRL